MQLSLIGLVVADVTDKESVAQLQYGLGIRLRASHGQDNTHGTNVISIETAAWSWNLAIAEDGDGVVIAVLLSFGHELAHAGNVGPKLLRGSTTRQW